MPRSRQLGLAAAYVMVLGCQPSDPVLSLGWPRVTLHRHLWDHGDWIDLVVDAQGAYVRRARGSTGGAGSKSTIETCSGQLGAAAVAPMLDAMVAAKLGDGESTAKELRAEAKQAGKPALDLRYVAAEGAPKQGATDRAEALQLLEFARRWEDALPRGADERCDRQPERAK